MMICLEASAKEGGKALMAQLTARARKRIPAKSFAIPGRAKSAKAKAKSGNYPIHDLAHARNALARVSQHGSPSERSRVRAAVYRKYPGLKKRAAKRK